MNITEVFNQEGKKQERIFPITKDMLEGNVSLREGTVTILFTNINKGEVLMEGQGEVLIEIPCDRCLASVNTVLTLSFKRHIYSPDVSIDNDTKEDQYYLEGYDLNINALLREEIMLERPTKILCRNDCKGICKKCGKDLNLHTCACDDFIPDVRFAGLMDLLER